MAQKQASVRQQRASGPGPGGRLALAAGLAVFAWGCGSGPEPGDPEPEPGPPEFLYSFVIVADPHIAGPPEHEQRLQAAVDWINSAQEEEAIELVLVLGDIGWNDGLPVSLDLLSQLEPTWVPVIGDNVVQTSGDASFASTFAPQLDSLQSELGGWSQADQPVEDPRLEGDAWLQNLRFEHQGVLFISQDWNIRHLSGTLAEFGDLNDVPGGSWEWLVEALDDAEQRPDESIVLLSHVPMAPGIFALDERDHFAELIAPIQDKVFANFAGHLHVDYSEDFPAEGYSTYVTDATWDDTNAVRLVRVLGNDVRREYHQEQIVLED